MSATISLKFGTLALSATNNITVGRISEKAAKPVQTTSIPKTDGAIAENAKIGPKTFSIEGDIAGTSYDDLRTNIDALHAGLLGQGLAKLTKDNERYIYAQLKDFSFAYDHLTRRATWTASFVAHFPFWLSETLKSDVTAPASGVGYVIANAGNAPTRTKIELTPASSMADACKVENTTAGEAFQYRGTVSAGQILKVDNRVDTDDFAVTNNGVDDHTNFEGDFITLNSLNNTIVFTGTASTSVKATWRDCWY